jgi:cell fate regulator YaaT (PSP1 superfamily)
MTKSVGVKLWDRGRLYYYNPTDLDLELDAWILVKTERALTPARVFLPSRPLLPLLEAPSLRPIVRKATPKDEERIRSCQALEQRVRAECLKGIAKHRLAMRLGVESTDRAILISFTAENAWTFAAWSGSRRGARCGSR